MTNRPKKQISQPFFCTKSRPYTQNRLSLPTYYVNTQITIMKYLILLHLLFVSTLLKAQTLDWGDQGNGTYINPILAADYSDPDVIRVGNKYYMTASEFHFMGMQILESTDLVNWTIIAQVYDRMDYPGWNENRHYAGGSWAPAIRYHDGKFWIYFCSPDEGLFMTTATDPHGPWAPLHLVKGIEKWEDPCPFWDEDGQAYLGRSRHRAGPIIIHKMSADGRTLLDEGVTVYTGPVAEGTKIHKIDGFYYISIPEGGVGEGWQTILRSKSIYGPYEKKVVLAQGSTDINGPHQGAMVDTPDGEWWFVHFQHYKQLGRIVHLQPMHWKDGWPVIGVDYDMDGIGEPVRVWTKPACGKVVNRLTHPQTTVVNNAFNNDYPSDKKADINKGNNKEKRVVNHYPQASDEFSTPTRGLQWQWNHNPIDSLWSLTERQGFLTLHAAMAPDFIAARNTLTQKTMGYGGEATTRMDFAQIAEGQRCGLSLMGKVCHQIGIMREDGHNYVYEEAGDSIINKKEIKSKAIVLKTVINAIDNSYQLLYSLDNGRSFQQMNNAFPMAFGHWKGVRLALFCYNVKKAQGKAAFDWLRYDFR